MIHEVLEKKGVMRCFYSNNGGMTLNQSRSANLFMTYLHAYTYLYAYMPIPICQSFNRFLNNKSKWFDEPSFPVLAVKF